VPSLVQLIDFSNPTSYSMYLISLRKLSRNFGAFNRYLRMCLDRETFWYGLCGDSEIFKHLLQQTHDFIRIFWGKVAGMSVPVLIINKRKLYFSLDFSI
jgi:hypothetical protein